MSLRNWWVLIVPARYVTSNLTSTTLWGAIYEGGLSDYSDIAAVVIGQYLRNKAPASLEADTARMCVLLNGEYGNLMPGLLFSGLAGDIEAQDQIWPFLFNATPSLVSWKERTGIDLDNVTAWLNSNMGPEQMGNWTDLVSVSSSTCETCSETSTWADILLWPTSVAVRVFFL